MNDMPPHLTGEHLSPDEYFDDFYPRFWRIGQDDFWKLERIQSFQEDGSDSWDAFVAGDRPEALRLIEDRRDALAEYYAKVRRSGFTTYRVRVVEHPISDYLHWQLHSLCQRAELGERIRVVTSAHIAAFEHGGRTLPEIVTVGTEAVYQVLYDDDGALTGAIRSDDPALRSQWRDFTRALYGSGEDVAGFVHRQAATLHPRPAS